MRIIETVLYVICMVKLIIILVLAYVMYTATHLTMHVVGTSLSNHLTILGVHIIRDHYFNMELSQLVLFPGE